MPNLFNVLTKTSCFFALFFILSVQGMLQQHTGGVSENTTHNARVQSTNNTNNLIHLNPTPHVIPKYARGEIYGMDDEEEMIEPLIAEEEPTQPPSTEEEPTQPPTTEEESTQPPTTEEEPTDPPTTEEEYEEDVGAPNSPSPDCISGCQGADIRGDSPTRYPTRFKLEKNGAGQANGHLWYGTFIALFVVALAI